MTSRPPDSLSSLGAGLGAPTDADRRRLAAIVRRLEPAELAERMVHEFKADIGAYRRLPDPIVAGQILEVSRRNVELFFDSILSGREPTEADLEPFRASARNRASEGMALEDLLAAYRQGGRFGWQAVRESAEPGDERAVVLAGELMMRYVDRVSAAVAQTYLDARQALVSEEERRLRHMFVALTGPDPVSAEMRELAERADLPLLDMYRPWSLTVPGAPARDHSAVASALRASGVLALTEGDRVTGIAAPSVGGEALSARGSVLALGEPTPRAQLSASLDDVRVLLEVALRLGRRGIVRSVDCLPELLLARSPRLAAELEADVLGRLERQSEGRTDLVATLAAFVECGLDRRATAARLHVHPNTLDYRLKRTAELTGLELSRPGGIVRATLALRQRELRGAGL